MDATEWMILPLRRYADFGGRSCRAEYWWFFLFALLAGIAAAMLDYIVGLKSLGFGTIVSLGLLVPQLAVGVRRLHDIGHSGWWLAGGVVIGMALGIVVAVGTIGGAVSGGAGLALIGVALIGYAILMLVWACRRGTAGVNVFGPDPLGDRAIDHRL